MNFTQLIDAVWEHKIRFAVTFFVVFTALYAVLYAVDFLPEPPTETAATTTESISETERELMSDDSDRLQSVSSGGLNIEIIDQEIESNNEPAPTPATSDVYVQPQSIYIERLEKTIPVLNPTSRLISDLDAALLEGVVRHPDSASLNQAGNVFILGHSSYLPNVFNPHFQAFNGIQFLEWGDTIEITGADNTVHVYRVERVYEARASDVIVPIAGDVNRLTIATCDSFGSTDDRFIVEAELLRVESAAA